MSWLVFFITAPFKDDNFGNPWLTNMYEVSPPPPISMLPNAPLWWLLAALLLCFGLHRVYSGVRYWRRTAHWRAAQRRLKRITRQHQQQPLTPSQLRDIAVWLRQLAVTNNRAVVSLTGSQWLAYLNSGLVEVQGDAQFDETLLCLPYWPDARLRAMAPAMVSNLLHTIGLWLLRQAAKERGSC